MRVEDVGLVERMIVVRRGKGGKRREVPIRRELALVRNSGGGRVPAARRAVR